MEIEFLSDDFRKTSRIRWILHAAQFSIFLAFFFALVAPQGAMRPALLAGLVLALLLFAVGLIAGRKGMDQLGAQKALADEARLARRQTEQLFNLTDMLQSADGNDDAGMVLISTARRLLPGHGGALYVFNNSRDRLDLVKSWPGKHQGFSALDTLLPGNCWALKRGKLHMNNPAEGWICCTHHISEGASLEVPMLARGKIHGLLIIGLHDVDDQVHIEEVARIARALADSMSLALSNIALREKLRTQSLRDPLTGLYNRRYMEDALERYISLGERNKTSTSVVMIDLDNFKLLNDEHGHAKGDAVLRDVAGQLVGGLRPSDVVARYGGEELMVILPDCSLDAARHKAEILRARIEALSDVHGIAISASLGIAAISETSTNAIELVSHADAALYRAKESGKNRVAVANRRARLEPENPVVEAIVEKPRLAVDKTKADKPEDEHSQAAA